MGIITKLIDAIEDEAIREAINHDIDTDFVYCGDWEVEMNHVNIYLNKLLMRRSRLSNKSVTKEEMRLARRVLNSVDDERDVKHWINDLKTCYFPVLEVIWG